MTIWEDDLKGRKGARKPAPVTITQSDKKALRLIINKTPEVVFTVSRSTEKGKDLTDENGKNIPGKVTHPSPRNAKALRGLAEYISRNESEVITDEQGLVHVGPDAVKNALKGWDLPEVSSKRREALHIVMGMPSHNDAGEKLDVAAVQRASEQTAAWLFRNHRYLIAHHIDSDSGHPHSHVIVKIEPKDPTDGTKRLDPKRQQLRRYRETFAEKLRANGVEANATSRQARLSDRRNLTQGQYKHYQRQDARNNTDTLGEKMSHRDSEAAKIQAERYALMSAALVASEDANDRQLGVDLAAYTAAQRGEATTAESLLITESKRQVLKPQVRTHTHSPRLKE